MEEEIKTKYCKKCNQIKELFQFNKNNKLKNGYTTYCRICIQKLNHNSYEKRTIGKQTKDILTKIGFPENVFIELGAKNTDYKFGDQIINKDV